MRSGHRPPPRPRFRHRLSAAILLACILVPVSAAEVTLNLKDANIRTLIETVSEATGKNFVIDPRVKGKVTVVSARPMNEEDLYQVFLSILQVHGYSAVQVGEVVKIVPDVNAKQGPIPVVPSPEGEPPRGDQMVTRVVPIENVPAAQLVPILRPLVPQQGHLAAYAASNALVISDRADNIERILDIIRRIDVPDSQEIELIPLRHASAKDVVQIITQVNQKKAKGQQYPELVITADQRTNSILLAGDKSARLRVRALVAQLDTPLEGGGFTQVVFLKHASAEELAPILLGVGRQQIKAEQQAKAAPAKGAKSVPQAPRTSRGASSTPEFDIQADPSNNALIITASPAQFARIKRVIDELDIRREQVLVETIIAEVNTDLSRELGFEFAAIPTEGGGPVVLSNIGGTGNTGGPLSDFLAGAANFGSGLFLGGADLDAAVKWAALLRALDGDAGSNILSTPTLVTMDNEEAKIVVGRNVPFVTGTFTTPGDGAQNPFQTIERQDVGITLSITPRINEGDTIRLDLEQEASNISPAAASLLASDIITDKRLIKTSVLVDNGGILVLGGLIQDDYRDTTQRVPVLSEIPFLGRLFRYDSTTKTKQNLMVFIHPVILRDEETATHVTGQKYTTMRTQQIEAAMDERGLIRGAVRNLPDLQELVTQGPDTRPETPAADPDEFLTVE